MENRRKIGKKETEKKKHVANQNTKPPGVKKKVLTCRLSSSRLLVYQMKKAFSQSHPLNIGLSSLTTEHNIILAKFNKTFFSVSEKGESSIFFRKQIFLFVRFFFASLEISIFQPPFLPAMCTHTRVRVRVCMYTRTNACTGMQPFGPKTILKYKFEFGCIKG